MDEFSAHTRAANLNAMAGRPVDVLVIGAGIVGAWIALTAALHGHRTALVEKGDFASGTSGKTSRLVHGGLRYLQQLRIRIVRQAARERDVLLGIAPDLVQPLPFLIPVYRERGPRGWQLRIGLWLYDLLSKDKVLPRRRWLSREQALRLEPVLAPDGLVKAATYADAITRDARLVLAVVRKAATAGALVANYARVAELLREGARVTGARIVDEESGMGREVRVHAVVNATGVWVNELQRADRRLNLRPSKGVHVLLRRERVGNRGAVVLPAADGRIVFVLPWGEFSLVGTTDTAYEGPRDRIEAEPEDVRYLLAVVNAGFPGAQVEPRDVVSSYAGLRPLIDTGEARESDISRRHEIIVDPDGLISVAGGKLTTARAMAEEVIGRVELQLLEAMVRATPPATPPDFRTMARRSRGWSAVDTRTIRIEDPWGAQASGDLITAAAHAARNEMALHLDDVLVRRTGTFHATPDHGLPLAPDVAGAMADVLGWNAERRATEIARYRELVDAERRWREPVDG